MMHARNIRLGLVINGFNPFGIMSNNYSMQSVVLMPYNMPAWKCTKDSFFTMSLLISGPQALSKDTYLCPLVDELKESWHDDVHTFDMLSGDYFCIHACLLWTINDFPVYKQRGLRHVFFVMEIYSYKALETKYFMWAT